MLLYNVLDVSASDSNKYYYYYYVLKRLKSSYATIKYVVTTTKRKLMAGVDHFAYLAPAVNPYNRASSAEYHVNWFQ